MPFTVHITKADTGETRAHEEPGEWSESSVCQWTNGNFGCDCNRRLFFSRANGESDPSRAVCTEGEFSIRVCGTDGTELYSEETPR